MGIGIRAKRRQGDADFIWKIYTVNGNINNSGSGHTSITTQKMVSTGYQVSSNGTFKLYNPTSKKSSNLAVGDYLVDLGSTNSTATTGKRLFRITNITPGKHYYDVYDSGNISKGTDTGKRANSETLDYPIDGLHTDGKWYVLTYGYITKYVWNIYNINPGYRAVVSVPDEIMNPPIGIRKDSTLPYYDGSSTVSYNNDSETTPPDISSGVASFVTKNKSFDTFMTWFETVHTHNHVYYGVEGADHYYDDAISFGSANIRAYRRLDIVNGQKGSNTGQVVESADATAYPQDGIQDNKWYTYSHSYEGWI